MVCRPHSYNLVRIAGYTSSAPKIFKYNPEQSRGEYRMNTTPQGRIYPIMRNESIAEKIYQADESKDRNDRNKRDILDYDGSNRSMIPDLSDVLMPKLPEAILKYSAGNYSVGNNSADTYFADNSKTSSGNPAKDELLKKIREELNVQHQRREAA